MTPRFGHRRSPAGARGAVALSQMPRVEFSLSAASSLIDNRALVLSVLDQGNLGSCELNAWAQSIRAEMMRQAAEELAAYFGTTFARALEIVKQAPPELPARLLLYWAAAAYDGDAGEGDFGTCSASVAQALATYGFMPESKWQYVDDGSKLDPGTALAAYERLAYDQRFGATARVDSDAMSAAQADAAIIAALDAKYLLPYACDVTAGWEALKPGQIWQGPADGTRTLGGHCVTIVARGPANQLSAHTSSTEVALLVLNSWGTSFCESGYFLMSRAALAHRYDVWCVSKPPTKYSGTR